MFVTLKLKDKSYHIHSACDCEKTITANNSFSIMPWKMVTRGGVNVSLEEAVGEIKKDEKEKKLARYSLQQWIGPYEV